MNFIVTPGPAIASTPGADDLVRSVHSAAPQATGKPAALIVAAFVVLGSIAMNTPWGIGLGVILLAWAIAGALGKTKSPAAWVLSSSSSPTKRSVVSLALGAFVTTCGLAGLSDRASRPARTEAKHEAPNTTTPTLAAPTAPTAAEIPLILFRNDDHQSPIKDQKSRVLLIQGELGEEALRRALYDYYQLMRTELETSTNQTRHVWLFAYPSAARAKAGGEWHGRASVMAFNGDPLPSEPEITLKMPNKEVPLPTAREDEIYDALFAELQAVDSAHTYQENVLKTRKELTMEDIEKMARLSEEDERQAKQKRRFRMWGGP